jgi:hypothetical protein
MQLADSFCMAGINLKKLLALASHASNLRTLCNEDARLVCLAGNYNSRNFIRERLHRLE